MGKQPDAARKAELLEAVVDYLLANGLTDLTLRPLAEAVGTNARMLLYYFGSRERLISEALEAAQLRQQRMLQEGLGGDGRLSPAERLHQFWAWLSSPATAPYIRFFFDFQVHGLLHQETTPRLAGMVEDWVTFVQSMLAREPVSLPEARQKATLLVAATRGLLLDLLTTGDRERVDQAFSLLLTDLIFVKEE